MTKTEIFSRGYTALQNAAERWGNDLRSDYVPVDAMTKLTEELEKQGLCLRPLRKTKNK